MLISIIIISWLLLGFIGTLLNYKYGYVFYSDRDAKHRNDPHYQAYTVLMLLFSIGGPIAFIISLVTVIMDSPEFQDDSGIGTDKFLNKPIFKRPMQLNEILGVDKK